MHDIASVLLVDLWHAQAPTRAQSMRSGRFLMPNSRLQEIKAALQPGTDTQSRASRIYRDAFQECVRPGA